MSARKYFGTDGIRGEAGVHPITPDFVEVLGRAAATVLAGGKEGGGVRAVIGRDTRAWGPMLEEALAAGMNAAGADVELLGVLPTPAVALGCRHRGADFAAVISASHNPAGDNGIKFFGGDGYKLADGVELAMEAAVDGGAAAVPGGASGKTVRAEGAREAYLKAALASVAGLDLKGLKVVVDAANGAASGITAEALGRLGAEVVEVGSSPDGTNINEGCGCMVPGLVESEVVASAADVGIAHDGDADRLVMVDGSGSALDGDELMAIAALDLARKGRLVGDTLVATVMSNVGLEVCLGEAGLKLLRTDVGDRYVIEEMRRGGYALGGEQSGHLIFHEFTTTGDGLVAALQLLSIVRETGRPLGELRGCLKKFPQVLRAVAVGSKPPIETVPALWVAIAEAEAQLGTRGRVLLRYSGTEPKLRILLEGEDEGELRSLCEGLEAVVVEAIQ